MAKLKILLTLLLLPSFKTTPLISEEKENIVTTSHDYDQSIEAPFRFNSLRIDIKEKIITTTIDYYINTNMISEINLHVNGLSKKEILTKTTSSKRLKSINLDVTPDYNNEIITIIFRVEWSQNYKMSARIFLNPEKIVYKTIPEGGNYKYSVLNAIIFNNETQKFKYFYDYIAFNIDLKKQYLYFNQSYIAEVKKNQFINSTIKIFNNKSVLWEKGNKNNSDIFTLIKNNPQTYKLQINIKYEKGIIFRNLTYEFFFTVSKIFFGNCDLAVICFIKGGNYDEVRLIKRETILI